MDEFNTKIIQFNITNSKHKNISSHNFSLHNKKEDIYWIHCNLNKTKDLKNLNNKLHLPDDFIELSLSKKKIPKIIETDKALFIKIQCPIKNSLKNKTKITSDNLVFILTKDYCLTASKRNLSALRDFAENYEKALPFAKTPCFILFLILDNIINDFSEILLDYEDLAEKVDIKIHATKQNIFNHVMDIKKSLMKNKRLATVIRDTLMRISGRKITVISDQCQLSLSHLFSHSQVIISENDVLLETINNSLDRLDNLMMQKLNESMRILTAFASICLPLSLIAAIYGMNFRFMPELQWQYGYYGVLFIMLIFAIILFIFFKIKKWF